MRKHFLDRNPSFIEEIMARYAPQPNMTRKRVLMISESNSIDFLEQKFRNHECYEVINEAIENIIAVGVKKYIQAVAQAIKQDAAFFDGITGFFDTPNAVAVSISHLTGKKSPSLESIVRCQNKFLCRSLQKESVPENTPAFVLARDFFAVRPFSPAFIKPLRAAGSFGCGIIHNANELQKKIEADKLMLHQFNQPYIEAIATASNDEVILQTIQNCNDYLCEEVITGQQFAVNGYIVNGNISLHGIVAEILLPNSKSFERHEHPTELSDKWLRRIDVMVERFISHTGLNNTEFDIEFFIDFEKDKLTIIEINPRAVAQYENLYAMASGDDMLTTICALACGDAPPPRLIPKYKFCYSWELRSFDDLHILEIPDAANLSDVYASYPDVKVVNRIPPGIKKLSESKRSIDTYRYCMISIPGNSRTEVMEIVNDIKQRLNYHFAPVN